MLRKVDTDPYSPRNARRLLSAMLRPSAEAPPATPSAAAALPGVSAAGLSARRLALGKAPPAAGPPPLPEDGDNAPRAHLGPGRPRPLRLAAKPGGDVLIGLDEAGAPVVWDPERVQNAFLCVFGASGSGKTEFLRVAAVTSALPAIVFDFHGDIRTAGATVPVRSVADVNPFEVVTEGGPVEQAGAFSDALRRAVPSLGHVQTAELRGAILRAYARVGIREADATTWTQRAPSIGELKQAIQAADMTRGAQAGLLAAVDQVFGAGAGRAPSVQIRELLRTGGRLDLSHLTRPAQVLASEVLLGQIWSALREAGRLPGGQYRSLLVVDEAAILNGSAALDVLFREARKFGLACVLAAQALSDVSAAVRNNAASLLVLKLGSAAEATAAARLLRGTSAQVLMDQAPQGYGFFRAGAAVTHVRVLMLDAPERRALRAAAPGASDSLAASGRRRR